MDRSLLLILFEDERRYLSLGTPSCLINYYHTVSLWTLLYVTMVPSVDWYRKRDSFGCVCLLAGSYIELLSEIDISWAGISTSGLESGK